MSLPKVKVTIGNRWTVFHCDPGVQVELKTFFRFMKPGVEHSELYRSGAWDGYTNLLQRGRVATGLFLAKRPVIERDYRLVIKDERVPAKFRSLDENDLRPYQIEGVKAMMEASATGGLVLCPTGSGKTRIAACLLRTLVGPACFLVDELSLLEQGRRGIEKVLGEAVGVVGNSKFEPRRITAATIQTLHRHRNKPKFKKWFEKLEVLVIDEVHVALNRRNIDVVTQVRPRAVYGLTATLRVTEPHVLLPALALCGPVIYEYSIKEGVEEGFLNEGVICRLLFRDTLKGLAPGYTVKDAQGNTVFIQAGSRPADYRYRIALSKPRNDCVEALVREAVRRSRRVAVLVERVAHLQILSRRLQDVRHRVLSGQYKQEERLDAMRGMDAGEVPVILANRVFSKGVDVTTLETTIDATALPGRDGTIQRYGRRRAAGIHIDVCDAGNQFAGAAFARKKALEETGAYMIDLEWSGDAAEVFTVMESRLARVLAPRKRSLTCE